MSIGRITQVCTKTIFFYAIPFVNNDIQGRPSISVPAFLFEGLFCHVERIDLYC